MSISSRGVTADLGGKLGKTYSLPKLSDTLLLRAPSSTKASTLQSPHSRTRTQPSIADHYHHQAVDVSRSARLHGSVKHTKPLPSSLPVDVEGISSWKWISRSSPPWRWR